jgi:hypothetical protein
LVRRNLGTWLKSPALKAFSIADVTTQAAELAIAIVFEKSQSQLDDDDGLPQVSITRHCCTTSGGGDLCPELRWKLKLLAWLAIEGMTSINAD